MPLSEDEKRILSEIEDQLQETDPELSREVGSTTVYTHAARNLRWAVLGFIVGLAVMVLTLNIHYVFAFGGFLIMLVAALYFEQNARRLGRAGIQQLSQSVRSKGFRSAFGDKGQGLRDRIRRDGKPFDPPSN